ncbi:hypothetical protein BN77_2639 [Rhizobium mesoamericanum STM3625]|uniref:Uncharacterized protein n=1 Tax=Rhizobium mesoamericanum STM3625 TaxID=1211777 RepID=K0PZJ9_9HYPH|nr:hypothetical protein BN77_2639 [Rhizobium mesoamericanum STM3625]
MAAIHDNNVALPLVYPSNHGHDRVYIHSGGYAVSRELIT